MKLLISGVQATTGVFSQNYFSITIAVKATGQVLNE
jgi:hypothetical protein